MKVIILGIIFSVIVKEGYPQKCITCRGSYCDDNPEYIECTRHIPKLPTDIVQQSVDSESTSGDYKCLTLRYKDEVSATDPDSIQTIRQCIIAGNENEWCDHLKPNKRVLHCQTNAVMFEGDPRNPAINIEINEEELRESDPTPTNTTTTQSTTTSTEIATTTKPPTSTTSSSTSEKAKTTKATTTSTHSTAKETTTTPEPKTSTTPSSTTETTTTSKPETTTTDSSTTKNGTTTKATTNQSKETKSTTSKPNDSSKVTISIFLVLSVLFLVFQMK